MSSVDDAPRTKKKIVGSKHISEEFIAMTDLPDQNPSLDFEKFVSGLGPIEKQRLFSLLVKDLHASGIQSEVVLRDPNRPEAVIAYLLSYAVRHNLNDPMATSESVGFVPVDHVEDANLVSGDDTSWMNPAEGFEQG